MLGGYGSFVLRANHLDLGSEVAIESAGGGLKQHRDERRQLERDV
jgi:hypothetical protein